VGFVEKRADKRWRARYRALDGRERSRTFTKKTDAVAWLDASMASQVRGDWIDPALGKMTFGEWVGRWEAGLVDLRPTTKALNLHVARKYLLPRFGSYPLSAIRTSDVKTMLADDIASGRLSNSTVRRHVLVLRTILEAARVDGRLARNPCVDVKLPPENARPMRFLTAPEIVRVADAIGPHYRPLVLTAGFVGLRFGELAGLAVDKVNLLARTIRVDQQLLDVDSRVQLGPPKTTAGMRTVTIPAGLADVLGEHFGSAPVVARGLAFPNTKGAYLRRAVFRRVWQGACRRAGFDDGPLAGLVFHELRHSAVALAVAEGAHPLAIKERLGHKSIETTMNTYGGLFPSLDEAISRRLDVTLSEALAASSRPEPSNTVHLRRSEGFGH
jgi:integrase